MTASRTRVGASGRDRHCSQLRSVAGGNPNLVANCAWLSPILSRTLREVNEEKSHKVATGNQNATCVGSSQRLEPSAFFVSGHNLFRVARNHLKAMHH